MLLRLSPCFAGGSLLARVIIVAVLLGSAQPTAAALTPASPEVQKAIERGIGYLTATTDTRVGAKALTARAMLATDRREHPRVAEAVAAIREALDNKHIIDIYSLGLCILFLVELDRQAYGVEIQKLLDLLVSYQKNNGAWGYQNKPDGDTSMTQYAVLGAWVGTEAGFQFPDRAWSAAANWLLRTQDPSGAFGYQGVESQSDQLVPQRGVSVTLAYAGLGSLYLCGNRLGLVDIVSDRAAVPDVFRPVDEASERARAQVDKGRFNAAIERAKLWKQGRANALPPEYIFYFFYTLERLETISEAIASKEIVNPAWYDDSAKYIVSKQNNDGSWSHTEGPVPATGFAVLSLVRSTKKVIESIKGYGAGTLISGRGLPSGKGDVEMRLGKVVVKPLTGPAEELLDRLDQTDSVDYDRAVAALDDLVTEADVSRLSPIAKRLRSLAAGGTPDAKAVALRGLARTRDMTHAPLLLEALSDPSPVVVLAAHDGLCFLSRRIGATKPPAQPTDVDRAALKRQWLEWYRGVAPAEARARE